MHCKEWNMQRTGVEYEPREKQSSSHRETTKSTGRGKEASEMPNICCSSASTSATTCAARETILAANTQLLLYGLPGFVATSNITSSSVNGGQSWKKEEFRMQKNEKKKGYILCSELAHLLVGVKTPIPNGKWGEAVCKKAPWFPIGVEVQELKLLIKAVQLQALSMPENVVWVPPDDHLNSRRGQGSLKPPSGVMKKICHEGHRPESLPS